MQARLTEFAPAKVNLALHVTGRRADGLHRLDGLVAFAGVGDELAAEEGSALTLAIDGPFAAALGAGPDNLVLRAATLIRPSGRGATLRLTKGLPPASGIGGGSADAAATLRLLARLWDVPLPEAAAAFGLGADVPVCLAGRACRMTGAGEGIEPLDLPPFWLTLANPGIPVATGAVFAALARRDNPPMPEPAAFRDAEALLAFLAAQRNDLEAPAVGLAPAISAALAALRAQPGCRLARMSGSGATCFGLFLSEASARAAAAAIRHAEPGWWVKASAVKGGEGRDRSASEMSDVRTTVDNR
ncbi:MAG: 4-(cytidine 5'-diphospho)-2-C-methyl-D-erythritol kinase [Amaricoccus sp.]